MAKPRVHREEHLLRRLKGLLPKALDALEHAVVHGSTNERLVAANTILDRTWGKAKQHVETDHNYNLNIAQEHVKVLQDLASRGRVIDVTPTPLDNQSCGPDQEVIAAQQ